MQAGIITELSCWGLLENSPDASRRTRFHQELMVVFPFHLPLLLLRQELRKAGCEELDVCSPCPTLEVTTLIVLRFLSLTFFFFSDGKLLLTKNCPWLGHLPASLAGAWFRTGIDTAQAELSTVQHFHVFG